MRRKRPALFCGYCVENGVRRRLRRDEIRECHRVWREHSDIRLKHVEEAERRRWGALPLDEPMPVREAR
jgi:hypothetical protein